jgi:death-on-curing protein
VHGNERTGFVMGVLFLELNGDQFTASEGACAHAVTLAAGTTEKRASANFSRPSSQRNAS